MQYRKPAPRLRLQLGRCLSRSRKRLGRSKLVPSHKSRQRRCPMPKARSSFLFLPLSSWENRFDRPSPPSPKPPDIDAEMRSDETNRDTYPRKEIGWWLLFRDCRPWPPYLYLGGRESGSGLNKAGIFLLRANVRLYANSPYGIVSWMAGSIATKLLHRNRQRARLSMSAIWDTRVGHC